MSDANTSALAETGDLDLSEAADMVPDDAFDLPEDLQGEAPEEHSDGALAPAENEATEEAEESADPTAETPPAETDETETTAPGPQSVIIGGKAIPVDEVERGFLRQADYTRKTQELATERQGFQAERETLAQERTQLSSILSLATDIVKAHLPPEPDPTLIDTDVIGYMQQERAYKAAMAEMQKLADARTQADAGSRKERETAEARTATEAREHLNSEYRLLQDKVPEIRTPEGHKAFFARAEAAGAQYGLTPDEVRGIADHRALIVLQDAARWRDLQTKKPAAIERAKAAPPIRTAPRQAPGTRSAQAMAAARARLEREGSIEAAAAMLSDDLFI